MSKTKNYTAKRRAVIMLAEMNIKKITNKEIRLVAKKYKLKSSILRRAWTTFQETGGKTFDRRVKTHFGTIKMTPTHLYYTKINYSITPSQAGSMILQYMHDPKISSREICYVNKVSVLQFYGWLHELEVKGTLMGRRVLDPQKYAKLNIKDVIWLKRNPNTKRKSINNLTTLERVQYRRVATVLEKYLPNNTHFLTRSTKKRNSSAKGGKNA